MQYETISLHEEGSIEYIVLSQQLLLFSVVLPLQCIRQELYTSRQAERMAGGVSWKYSEMLDESDGVLVDQETHT